MSGLVKMARVKTAQLGNRQNHHLHDSYQFLQESYNGRLTVEVDITHGWKGFVRIGHWIGAGSGYRLITEATQEINLGFFRLRGCRLR
jgi:hypothetical protein